MKFFNRLNKADWWVIVTVAGFLSYKLVNLTFRFGDGNAYVYMANALWHGLIPYRDYFLADPPFLILFLSFFKLIFGSHWLLYSGLPYLIEVGSALVLYLIARRQPLGFLAPILYLFSFSILSTSEFLTGVQLAILFSLLGFYLQSRKPYLSGVFWGLAAMTKLYILPAWIGFWLYLVFTKQGWLKPTIGFFGSIALVLLPFLILSPKGTIDSLLLHQFHRAQGLNPWTVWKYFLQREWPLIILAGFSSLHSGIRKFIWPFCLTVVFFLIFQDLYYTYLAYLIFFLVLLAAAGIGYLQSQTDLLPIYALSVLLVSASVISGIYYYQTTVRDQGRFLNSQEIADYLKTQTDHSQIYGSHEVAPLLALQSGKTLFGNYIDTNAQVFAAGTEDKEQVSRDAVRQGVYLVARITDLPEYQITDQGYEGYFSPEVFAKNCRRLELFASTSRESDNYIGIYDCLSID